MTNHFEINQHTIIKDYGHIILYQRSDHKTPRWQTRIKIDGAEYYIRKSTKTLDFSKAESFAVKLYLALADKFRITGSIQTKSFIQVVDEWLTGLHKPSNTIADFRSRLYSYPIRFWGNLSMDKLQQSDLTDFIEWRKSHGAIKPNPSSTTIKRDLVPLRQVLKYAYGRRYISQHLKFDGFKVESQRRPAFNEEEWNRIIQKLPEWCYRSAAHRRHFRDRFYLQNYVLLIGYSGIRAGTEARSLTWDSLRRIDLNNNNGNTISVVVNYGKRGPRVVIPHQAIGAHLLELKKFRINELAKQKLILNDAEAIFSHENGQPIHSFKKGFKAFLDHYKLLSSSDGRTRTLYSLRHTYATLLINQGGNHWDLARNMGTSVEQLEKFYVHSNPTLYGRRILELTDPVVGNHEIEAPVSQAKVN